jgi:AraC-like DNA-binding protein
MSAEFRTTPRASVQPADPGRYAPTADRPVRVSTRRLSEHTEIVPHRHAWAQVAVAVSGVARIAAGDLTCLVPAWRAVWIPPQVEHVVHVLETAELRTLYIHQADGDAGPAVPRAEQAAWRTCRVVEVSPLLRELVRALGDDETPPGPDDASSGDGSADIRARERLLGRVVLDELRRARALPLGVALPRDKRLRALCEAVVASPGRHARLEDWAHLAGASPRTVARLFRQELGTSFGPWRQQVLLARGLALAAQGRPVGWIAGELGYASASAFTAMVRRAVGEPAGRWFKSSRAPR